MKNITFLIIILLFSINSTYSQNNKESFEKLFERAEKIFSNVNESGSNESIVHKGANAHKEGYKEAIPLLLDLLKQEPGNCNIAFKLGICYKSLKIERAKAIPYFIKAVASTSNSYNGDSHKEKNAPLTAYKYLGDAYHLNYQFDNAILEYEKYISAMAENKNTDKDLLAETNRKIEMCKNGKILLGNPINIKIQNLGSTVNSVFADYSPVLSADQNTLFFTSRRQETTGTQKDDNGNNMEDIYMSEKTKLGWSKAKNIGAPINSQWHDASVGISPDGQTILIYKDDNGDGNIYSTSLDGDIWSTPVKLNDNINTKHWEPSAFISADGNTLYFISDKPDGYGGRDLYMSKRTSEGDWGKSVNMGPNINTPYDEDSPFIHPDGVTLSYSSNGHNTMGGFDIFTSLQSEDGIWSEPVNVGYPINTTDDDVFYVVSPNNRTAYLSSFRVGGLGEKDNYMVTFLDRKETPLTLVKGVVNNESNFPAKKVVITVTDNETGEIAGVYNTNSKTGKFLFILTPGKKLQYYISSPGPLILFRKYGNTKKFKLL